MIGNDVVDLRDPESDPASLHPRFDIRVFSASEREAIAASAEPARERWRFWAAKEAVYKLVKKARPTTVFSPPDFAVAREGPGELRVRHEGQSHRVVLTENEGALHAVATRAGEAPRALVQGWRRLDAGEIGPGDPDAPGRAARSLLCECVAPRLGVPVDELEVRRHGRVPQLWLRGARAPVDVSLSHHGAWLAFACEIEDRAFESGTGAPE